MPFFFFKKILTWGYVFIDFRERGREEEERERERERDLDVRNFDQLPPVYVLTGD